MLKNFLLIILLVIVTFWAINLLDYKEPYTFDIVKNVKVSENQTEIELYTSNEIGVYRWFQKNEIIDECLYITTYKVLNPLSKKMGPQFIISINKGETNFNKIYLNDENGNRLIWEKP